MFSPTFAVAVNICNYGSDISFCPDFFAAEAKQAGIAFN
jgi:hypothetical protein